MSKRKNLTHRTPGSADDFARGDDAAIRLAVLDGAVTGVVRPTPLGELSQLLRVEVLDVERWDFKRGRRTWYLLFAADPAHSFRHYDSTTQRSAQGLQEIARMWGRDAALPELTRQDVRRCARCTSTPRRTGAS